MNDELKRILNEVKNEIISLDEASFKEELNSYKDSQLVQVLSCLNNENIDQYSIQLTMPLVECSEVESLKNIDYKNNSYSLEDQTNRIYINLDNNQSMIGIKKWSTKAA